MLAPGIDAAFALVRDEVRYEAYPGVLRGASGAYLARAANAADRSLLLAAFLNVRNVRTRFATGRLGRSDAERLFEHNAAKGRTWCVDPVTLASWPCDDEGGGNEYMTVTRKVAIKTSFWATMTGQVISAIVSAAITIWLPLKSFWK